MMWVGILLVGILAGTVGGIVGFGGSTILMPVLVFAFGPKDAVPIMGLAGTLANLSRVVIWWREVDLKAAGVYAATGVPAVILGANLFLALDARIVEMVLGVFMMLMVPLRRWFMSHSLRVGLGGLAAAGAGLGFLTGLVASTGPISTPFFLAYGLVKGAFIATEALGSLAIYLTKTIVFGHAGVLPPETIGHGLLVGAAMMIGSWMARRFVLAMDGEQYRTLLDGLMVAAGIAMIVASIR